MWLSTSFQFVLFDQKSIILLHSAAVAEVKNPEI